MIILAIKLYIVPKNFLILTNVLKMKIQQTKGNLNITQITKKIYIIIKDTLLISKDLYHPDLIKKWVNKQKHNNHKICIILLKLIKVVSPTLLYKIIYKTEIV